MPIAHGRQAERVIRLCVFFVADPDEGRFEELDDGREDLLSGQSSPARSARHAPANPWQRPREADELFVLVFVTHLAPARMITVLFAARASWPVTCKWPSGSRQSTRRSRPAGSPGCGCGRAFAHLESACWSAQYIETIVRAFAGEFRGGIIDIVQPGLFGRSPVLRFLIAGGRALACLACFCIAFLSGWVTSRR